jgi:dUTP pyrophosphatase
MREKEALPVKVKKLSPRARLCAYETAGAAGMDVCALLDAPLELPPRGRAKVPTGLAFEIPPGFEAQVRPRSGLAFKSGVTVLNAPGTIDADYRGELSILLINFGEKTEIIQDGERIAQLVFAPVVRAALEESGALGETARGGGGFGSTGR